MCILLFAAATFVASCANDDDDTEVAPIPATISFGALYSINDNAVTQFGVALPALAGDSLLLEVGYSGCSSGHEFELRSRLLNAERAEIWLYKLTPDEACLASFAPRESFRVPIDVLSRNEIDLIGPNFGVYPLR